MVALELYEHQKLCAEWHMHFSVLPVAIQSPYTSPLIFKMLLENVMVFEVDVHCLAGYDLIFN